MDNGCFYMLLLIMVALVVVIVILYRRLQQKPVATEAVMKMAKLMGGGHLRFDEDATQLSTFGLAAHRKKDGHVSGTFIYNVQDYGLAVDIHRFNLEPDRVILEGKSKTAGDVAIQILRTRENPNMNIEFQNPPESLKTWLKGGILQTHLKELSALEFE
jgi:hypothetical protein